MRVTYSDYLIGGAGLCACQQKCPSAYRLPFSPNSTACIVLGLLSALVGLVVLLHLNPKQLGHTGTRVFPLGGHFRGKVNHIPGTNGISRLVQLNLQSTGK